MYGETGIFEELADVGVIRRRDQAVKCGQSFFRRRVAASNHRFNAAQIEDDHAQCQQLLAAPVRDSGAPEAFVGLGQDLGQDLGQSGCEER